MSPLGVTALLVSCVVLTGATRSHKPPQNDRGDVGVPALLYKIYAEFTDTTLADEGLNDDYKFVDKSDKAAFLAKLTKWEQFLKKSLVEVRGLRIGRLARRKWGSFVQRLGLLVKQFYQVVSKTPIGGDDVDDQD